MQDVSWVRDRSRGGSTSTDVCRRLGVEPWSKLAFRAGSELSCSRFLTHHGSSPPLVRFTFLLLPPGPVTVSSDVSPEHEACTADVAGSAL